MGVLWEVEVAEEAKGPVMGGCSGSARKARARVAGRAVEVPWPQR